VLALINSAKQQAMQAVNTRLIELYWQVGAYISRKLEQAEWGDAMVNQLAAHLAQTQPGLRGFTRPNLFRMRQFYETYRENEKVSPLTRQLPWTHNLIILSQSKRPEEREFYLRMAVQEKWSKRELERQLKAALFERSATHPAKMSAVMKQRSAVLPPRPQLPGGH
jgi:predicted nuclease of restriction endonuclease-like (RecB) superfamily